MYHQQIKVALQCQRRNREEIVLTLSNLVKFRSKSHHHKQETVSCPSKTSLRRRRKNCPKSRLMLWKAKRLKVQRPSELGLQLSYPQQLKRRKIRSFKCINKPNRKQQRLMIQSKWINLMITRQSIRAQTLQLKMITTIVNILIKVLIIPRSSTRSSKHTSFNCKLSLFHHHLCRS